MSRLQGGDKAPRSGNIEWVDANGDSRQVTVKVGDTLSGGAEDTYLVGELRCGEIVPKDGVWFDSVTGEEHELHAGDTFPGTDTPAAVTGRVDFIWVRES